MIGVFHLVACEFCGRPTMLYPSELKLLGSLRSPGLRIACDHCIEHMHKLLSDDLPARSIGHVLKPERA